MQKVFPFFSSRDVRNIQSAISLRLTDFDLENDWFDNPEFVLSMILQEPKYFLITIPFAIVVIGFYKLLKKIFSTNLTLDTKPKIAIRIVISILFIFFCLRY